MPPGSQRSCVRKANCYDGVVMRHSQVDRRMRWTARARELVYACACVACQPIGVVVVVIVWCLAEDAARYSLSNAKWFGIFFAMNLGACPIASRRIGMAGLSDLRMGCVGPDVASRRPQPSWLRRQKYLLCVEAQHKFGGEGVPSGGRTPR